MKLSISNIAWRKEEEAQAAEILQAQGVQFLEVAPTKIEDVPANITPARAEQYRQWWADRGVTIVAMQALLFGQPDLKVFDTEASRQALLAYLTMIADLGQVLGVKYYVFGSPKNRTKGALTHAQAEAIAVPFFRQVGDVFAQRGGVLLLEPNPPAYTCDWLTSPLDAIRFVDAVNHPNISWQNDASTITINVNDPRYLVDAGARLQYFHASEPFLEPLNLSDKTDHATLGATLRQAGYQGYVSIEQRDAASPETNLANVEASILKAKAAYQL